MTLFAASWSFYPRQNQILGEMDRLDRLLDLNALTTRFTQLSGPQSPCALLVLFALLAMLTKPPITCFGEFRRVKQTHDMREYQTCSARCTTVIAKATATPVDRHV